MGLRRVAVLVFVALAVFGLAACVGDGSARRAASDSRIGHPH